MSAKRTSSIRNEKYLSAKIHNISQIGNNTELIVAFVRVNLTLETVSVFILIFPLFCVFGTLFIYLHENAPLRNKSLIKNWIARRKTWEHTLRKKYPYSKLFWSAFSGHFLRSDISSK